MKGSPAAGSPIVRVDEGSALTFMTFSKKRLGGCTPRFHGRLQAKIPDEPEQRIRM